MKRRVAIFSIFFLLSFLTGCDRIYQFFNPKPVKVAEEPQAPTVKGTIIAKVNNKPITLEELNQEIDNYNALVPEDKPELKITTREQKINHLKKEMVQRALLSQEALNRGLERKEEVVSALEKAKSDILIVELIKEEAEKVDVSSKEVEDYYNAYKEQLKEPEERQIREIVLPTEQEAKEALIELLQGADFATLAKDRSKSASAKEGGDLGFVPKGKKSAQFDAVAFSETLEVGKISNIFKGPDGYYILKLEGRRGGKQKSFSEMFDDIKRVLTFVKQQQKIEELLGKLSREAKLEFYEGEIK